MADLNQEGRKANAAQPLGDREGIQSRKDTKKTGERERRSAGPDGPRATEITSRQNDPSQGKRR